MSGGPSLADVRVVAGLTGDNASAPYGVRAYDVTAVQFDVSPIPELAGGAGNAVTVWLSFRANVDWYLEMWVNSAGAPTIDPAARAGDGPTVEVNIPLWIPAGVEYMRAFDASRDSYSFLSDGADGVLRVERCSVLIGGNNVGA